MKLSRTVKVLVGILTLCVIGVPFLIMPIVFLILAPSFSGSEPSPAPPVLLDLGFPLAFLLICFISLAYYALIPFYLAHIVKNPSGSDILRIALGVTIFLFPYLGMPAYYLIYVWPETPPVWALQPPSPPPPEAT